LRKILIALALSASAFSMTACVTPVKHTGTVVEKDYDQATYKPCKRGPLCKTGQKVKEKENWDITIRPSGAPEDGSQDIEVDVTIHRYGQCKIGDFYDGQRCD